MKNEIPLDQAARCAQVLRGRARTAFTVTTRLAIQATQVRV
jgi:hypothetical protein